MNIDISWPASAHPAIVPVFLPFGGCKRKCVFCAQDRQTGKDIPENIATLRKILENVRANLVFFKRKWHKPAELAFYGGTFTALPSSFWQECLSFIGRCLEEKIIHSIRCSTRPDAVYKTRLDELAKLSCGTIELGIQSFNQRALELSERNYGYETAISACNTILQNGFDLGIQLLPGMPGASPEVFMEDIHIAVGLRPRLVRFYPCLVIEGTGLARLWRNGEYSPWGLEESLEYLSEAWKQAISSNITVSRTGLAPDRELFKSILAGPVHPSLGSRVAAIALYKTVTEQMARNGIARLSHAWLPKYIQGFFWGWKSELGPFWKACGLAKGKIDWWEKSHIRLEAE